MTDNSVILLKDVTRSFGEKQVLKGVSFNVNKGEIFGLLGPSGAGKTTIINILTGQLSCGGDAGIFGVNSAKIGREVYRRTGAVLDNAGLYERLSCAEMKEAAEILCKDFPFVRVDFFVANNTWYFAELTFTPGAGMMPFNPESIDSEWGEMIDLPKTEK